MNMVYFKASLVAFHQHGLAALPFVIDLELAREVYKLLLEKII